MNRKELAEQVALQCAPLLMGIKVSNILIVGGYEEKKVRELFEGSALSYHILFKCNKRVVFLLYDKKKLIRLMSGEAQRAFLYSLGYVSQGDYHHEDSSVELTDSLKELSARYQFFMDSKGKFPHELGIFLGYPVQDVKSFIEYKGKHFLYTGYWKVYHNLPEALATFESFNRAKKKITSLIAKGFNIKKIIASYPNRVAVKNLKYYIILSKNKDE